MDNSPRLLDEAAERRAEADEVVEVVEAAAVAIEDHEVVQAPEPAEVLLVVGALPDPPLEALTPPTRRPSLPLEPKLRYRMDMLLRLILKPLP